MKQKTLDFLYRLVMYFTAASLAYTVAVALYVLYAYITGDLIFKLP